MSANALLPSAPDGTRQSAGTAETKLDLMVLFEMTDEIPKNLTTLGVMTIFNLLIRNGSSRIKITYANIQKVLGEQYSEKRFHFAFPADVHSSNERSTVPLYMYAFAVSTFILRFTALVLQFIFVNICNNLNHSRSASVNFSALLNRINFIEGLLQS